MATAAARRGSAYPVAVPELVPTARAAQLGRLPSRHQLMRELRVGAGKASRLLAMLTTEAASGAELAAVPTDVLASWVADRDRCLWETTLGQPSPWTGKDAWLLGADRPVVCRAIRTGALPAVRRRSGLMVSAHVLVWLLDALAVTVTSTPGGWAGGGAAR